MKSNQAKDIPNSALLEFIKENVVMKEDLKGYVKEDNLERFATKDDLERFATKDDLEKYATKSDLQVFTEKIITQIEKLATRLSNVLDKDYPFQKMRISRLEFRTETILGKNLEKVDKEFDKHYWGST